MKFNQPESFEKLDFNALVEEWLQKQYLMEPIKEGLEKSGLSADSFEKSKASLETHQTDAGAIYEKLSSDPDEARKTIYSKIREMSAQTQQPNADANLLNKKIQALESLDEKLARFATA